jgi:hypothetical protein
MNSSALIKASKTRDTKKVQRLLNNGVNVEAKDTYDSTALIVASENGYTEIVTMLLNNGADVNAMDENYRTALHWASYNGHIDIVTMLLNNKANVNAMDDNGKTALIVASENGHIDIVTMLLNNKANVNAMDDNGKTALIVANENGHTNIVKLLKKHIVAQTLPRHLKKQQIRLQVGSVMDSKEMPEHLTHKIITEHFGGKRKTNKRKLNKKKQTKKRKTLKKNKKSNRKQKGGNEKDIKKYIKDVIKDVIKMLKEFNNETDLKKKVQKFKNLINNLIEKLKIQYEVNENNLEMQGGDNHVNPDISVIRTSITEIRLRVIWLITTLSIIARALERAENDMLEGRVLGPFGLTFRTLLISFGVALVAFVISGAVIYQYNILDVHTNSLEALQEQLNYDIDQLNIMQNGNNTIDDNTIGELLEVMIGMRTEIANAISVRLRRPT